MTIRNSSIAGGNKKCYNRYNKRRITWRKIEGILFFQKK
jgi:hypothetical protein